MKTRRVGIHLVGIGRGRRRRLKIDSDIHDRSLEVGFDEEWLDVGVVFPYSCDSIIAVTGQGLAGC